MFKILITTSYWSTSGTSIHTVVAEFETVEEALKAVNAVNGNKVVTQGGRREALPLF